MSDDCWAARDVLSAKKDTHSNAKNKLSDLNWKKNDLDADLQSAMGAMNEKTAEANQARSEFDRARAKAEDLMRRYEAARDAWQAAVGEQPRDAAKIEKLKSVQDGLYAEEKAASDAVATWASRKGAAEQAETSAKAEHQRVTKLVATMKTTITNQTKKVKDAAEEVKKAQKRVDEVCD